MTQFFAENGEVIPVTVVKAPEVIVTQVKKSDSKDGYNAIQVGFSIAVKGSRNDNKAKTGHSKNLGQFGGFTEFRVEDASAYQVGQKIDISTFQIGDIVNCTGTMKGRGFAGAIKRHGFAGFPASHGHNRPRSVGSIGQRYPQHVNKGHRMSGHMGNSTVTVKNLQVVDVDLAKKLIMLKGAVPGANGGMVRIVTTGTNKPLVKVVADTGKKKK